MSMMIQKSWLHCRTLFPKRAKPELDQAVDIAFLSGNKYSRVGKVAAMIYDYSESYLLYLLLLALWKFIVRIDFYRQGFFDP